MEDVGKTQQADVYSEGEESLEDEESYREEDELTEDDEKRLASYHTMKTQSKMGLSGMTRRAPTFLKLIVFELICTINFV
uniref:Uncharacterized protein n=1 Tax=Ditylenchus dipsaci TaxID=166011 RepID=A0A915DLA4_9BILA